MLIDALWRLRTPMTPGLILKEARKSRDSDLAIALRSVCDNPHDREHGLPNESQMGFLLKEHKDRTTRDGLRLQAIDIGSGQRSWQVVDALCSTPIQDTAIEALLAGLHTRFATMPCTARQILDAATGQRTFGSEHRNVELVGATDELLTALIAAACPKPTVARLERVLRSHQNNGPWRVWELRQMPAVCFAIVPATNHDGTG
jgi:hypothetical protein